MKILYVITGLSLGGAEKQVCQLADSFSSIGHDVLVISLISNVEVRPTNPNIKVITLDLTKNPTSLFKALIKFCREMKVFTPDVVHSHMVHANLFCRLSRLFYRMPKLITSAHSNFEGGGWRTFAYRYTDRLSDLTTNVSEDAVRTFIDIKAVPENKIEVVYNGVCDKRFKSSATDRKAIRARLGISDDTHLILSVGRLEKAKDFPSLLYAFSNIQKSLPNTKLAIIGKGSLKNELLSIARKSSISDNVIFVGAIDSTNMWYSAADLFVSSSAWEGFGLVLAEAMLHGLPVVATDSGGSREVIGSFGPIVPVGNSEALSVAITDSLRKILLDTDVIKSSRRNFIQKKFSANTIQKKWLELYLR